MKALAILLFLVIVACALLSSNAHKPFELRVDANPGAWPTNASATVSAVQAPGLITAPIDSVGRAKFPGEKPESVDTVAFINLTVNNVILPVSDQSHYGTIDKMVSWPDDLEGDCEDYALSKLVALSSAGLNIVENARLRLVYAPIGGQLVGHAVLEVLLPGGSIAVLDSHYDTLMTRPELEAQGYQFFDWQEAKP